ncbi:hypothetical protein [Pelomonas sp. SE-A7]|uniref:hypothetical protein n=1 Tax=Pelomonas sp. SE-A7 TaxID=3054953 RepID=UPI00259D052B|nr:hypothetical protein [Pelomonas sp. SE-A7]MDM4765597.1 hypothetical protein [Pelomonas sp. SE-A7]
MNRIYCYDRYAQVKRLALVFAIMITAAGASALTVHADPQVAQLPRVEITGQSIETQVARARENQTVAQLPRVVIDGQRTLDGQRVAARSTAAQ